MNMKPNVTMCKEEKNIIIWLLLAHLIYLYLCENRKADCLYGVYIGHMIHTEPQGISIDKCKKEKLYLQFALIPS